jgi:hypothetical protein
MAAKKRKKAAARDQIGQVVKTLKKEGHERVLVVGRVRNGKVELDQSKLNEFARLFPKATASFVAVNAPFDPEPTSPQL